MMIREPAVAGLFYAADSRRCRADLAGCIDRAVRTTPVQTPPDECDRFIGGIVPHAGWLCSGAVAARVFTQIASRAQPDVLIVFGAIHVPHGPVASLFPSGAWRTPLGLAGIDERLGDRLCGRTSLLDPAPQAHEREHSIEVELPFIQHLLPGATIVPIMVPPAEPAVALGHAVGQTCRDYGVRAAFIASTDLTHYGPAYGFTPQGVGPDGLRWARQVNDRRMIDLILALREKDAVPEAAANKNACGSGAIAATLAACRACGARRATLLEHTASDDVLGGRFGEPIHDAVGYAAILLHE
jgi:AmmeMemoRadiSam system protein B